MPYFEPQVRLDMILFFFHKPKLIKHKNYLPFNANKRTNTNKIKNKNKTKILITKLNNA